MSAATMTAATVSRWMMGRNVSASSPFPTPCCAGGSGRRCCRWTENWKRPCSTAWTPNGAPSAGRCIILETIASLNEINPLTTRLIQIARDGKISDDEMKDFAYISKKLDEISLAIDSLNLWVDKTAGEQGLNLELLNAEKEKLK